MKKKPLAVLLACTFLVAVGAIGGSMAWLADQTDVVENTFTVGDINIELKEHEWTYENGLDASKETETDHNEYIFVPGMTLDKDPFVRVLAGSEPCWVFIKVDESSNVMTDSNATVEKIIQYDVDMDNWKAYDNENYPGYYYYKQSVTADSDLVLPILKDDKVKVSVNVKKTMLNEINASKPELKFKAAAVQYTNLVNIKDAWAALPSGVGEFRPE